MKYLFVKSEDPKRVQLIPVVDTLYVDRKNGVPFLSLGGRPLMNLDERNTTELLPFLADAFNRCDVVTIQCDQAYP